MEVLTGLGKSILAADPDRIRLDETVKSILAYKPLAGPDFQRGCFRVPLYESG